MTEDSASETPISSAKAGAMTASPNLIAKRFAYALAAFFCSLPFTIWLASFAVSEIVGMDSYEYATSTRQTTAVGLAWLSMLIGGTVVPTISAWLLFPHKDRSVSNLVQRGAAVVMFTMLLGPLFPLAASYVLHGVVDVIRSISGLERLIKDWFAAMVFGNLFTLGLPWLTGMGVSAAFFERRG